MVDNFRCTTQILLNRIKDFIERIACPVLQRVVQNLKLRHIINMMSLGDLCSLNMLCNYVLLSYR